MELKKNGNLHPLDNIKVTKDETTGKLKIEVGKEVMGVLQLEADKRKITVEEYLKRVLK